MTPMEAVRIKSERINQELLFLSGKTHFNLSDIMKQFNISKSTALRDMQVLERLGVPLYTEEGRYGGYRLVHQSLLTPIYFNEKEIAALFFSLQCLKFLGNTPFKTSYEQIHQKLLKTFSQERQEFILSSTEMVQYEGTPQTAPVENLEQIFQAILANESLDVLYRRYEVMNKRILPIRLTIMDGFWYCVAWDLEKEAWRTYRCDYLAIISAQSSDLIFNKEQITASFQTQSQEYRTMPFKVKLTSKGKDHFLRRHFANMALEEQEDLYLTGAINEQEMDFLVTYLLGFGEEAIIMAPASLKEAYIKRLKEMLEHY